MTYLCRLFYQLLDIVLAKVALAVLVAREDVRRGLQLRDRDERRRRRDALVGRALGLRCGHPGADFLEGLAQLRGALDGGEGYGCGRHADTESREQEMWGPHKPEQ